MTLIRLDGVAAPPMNPQLHACLRVLGWTIFTVVAAFGFLGLVYLAQMPV